MVVQSIYLVNEQLFCQLVSLENHLSQIPASQPLYSAEAGKPLRFFGPFFKIEPNYLMTLGRTARYVQSKRMRALQASEDLFLKNVL